MRNLLERKGGETGQLRGRLVSQEREMEKKMLKRFNLRIERARGPRSSKNYNFLTLIFWRERETLIFQRESE